MRCLNEHLARRANEEDGCNGRFWEGRFKSQALLDEAAVLTCMSYVDLNPVRAGLANTPEASDFTSVQQRVQEMDGRRRSGPAIALVDLESRLTDCHTNHFAFSTTEYLELLDWVGRAVREGKRGSIPEGLPPILVRLGIEPHQYLRHVRKRGGGYHAAALGRVSSFGQLMAGTRRELVKGIGLSRRLFAPPAV